MIRVIIRGFLGAAMQFETPIDADEDYIDNLLPGLGEQHAHSMADGKIDMIEIEFPDDPDPNDRFLRFGVSPQGMVAPIEFDLTKPPFMLPTHCPDPKCGAYLAGSWTKHKPECEFGTMIRDFEKGKA